MTQRHKKIVIIGAGQIGSRHLQAMKSVSLPLEILIVDPSTKSLQTAEERYLSMPKGKFEHALKFQNSMPNNLIFDLAIIATCSDIRAKVTAKLLNSNRIDNLVLEKILFANGSDYKTIGKLLNKSDATAWINCPMRMMPAYQAIEKYFKKEKISYIVTGSKFGLITNAIHYLDHASHLSGTTEFEINTDGLNSKPISSKRKGFLEFNGTLTAHFSNGSNVSLTCHPEGNAPIIVEIHGNKTKYIGRESEGKAWLARADNNWHWEELEAPIPFQSQLTTILTEKILNTGKCDLVSYNESGKIHLNMLEPLRYFLNKNSKKKYKEYPFT
ncbi:MAG: Gfo/Idh/MocA family oxidoreductase [Candidatus Yanofskybacteria bacterium]|nr:Gfo/Idh/MocA family oxidoreductase [Candidatus Yanofskybacteria bacterium]